MKLTLCLTVLMTLLGVAVCTDGQGRCSDVKDALYFVREIIKHTNHCEPQTSKSGGFVAFSAALTKNFVGKYGTALVFDDAITNSGGHYNKDNGIFTVPRNGFYYFDWTILSSPGHLANTYLMVNKKMMRGNNSDSVSHGKFGYRAGSSSVLLELKRGDHVWITPYSSSTDSHIHSNLFRWTSFQGWEVHSS